MPAICKAKRTAAFVGTSLFFRLSLYRGVPCPPTDANGRRRYLQLRQLDRHVRALQRSRVSDMRHARPAIVEPAGAAAALPGGVVRDADQPSAEADAKEQEAELEEEHSARREAHERDGAVVGLAFVRRRFRPGVAGNGISPQVVQLSVGHVRMFFAEFLRDVLPTEDQ